MALGPMGVRCLKEQLSDYLLYNRYMTTFVNHKEMLLPSQSGVSALQL